MRRQRANESENVENEEQKATRPGIPIDLHRLVRAVKRGRRKLILTSLIGIAAGLVIGKFIVKHTYEASASIRYEGLPGQEVLENQSDLPSLVSVSTSEPIMIALRRRAGMPEASVDALRKLAQVESDSSSGLVTYKTTAETPQMAARMANTWVALFLDHHRARRRRELVAELRSLDERVQAAQRDLRDARRSYDRFREANHITDLTVEQEQGITQVAHLRSQSDLAQAELEALDARVRQLTTAVQQTPRLQAVSSGASPASQRVRELRARLAEARSTYSDDHPQVQAMQNMLSSLQRQAAHGGGTATRMGVNNLHEQMRTSLAQAQTELEATRQRRQSLEQLAVEGQARMNRFSTIEGQAATLLAQVNVKQSLLNELNEQRAHAEDQLRDIQTGFRSVATARPPESAVPSSKKYLVAAAVPMTLVSLMLALLFFGELRGLRVQTPAEVAWWGNGPVIGTTTWPRDPRALIDLIADMDDFAPEAKGTILVVGSTDTERDLASEIADQLNHDWSTTSMIDVPVIGTLPLDSEEWPPERPPEDVLFGDEPLEEDSHGDAIELVHVRSAYEIELARDVRPLSAYAPPPLSDIDDPGERLICTAWNGPSEGQALRRAARLADRVLVVVTSDWLPASVLAQFKKRLGRDEAVGYVLVGVSDEVALLPDRAGRVEEFWQESETT